ncbi:MAG: hypothetical protein ACKVQB_08535 [Bacteroidia bacterium]
MNTQEKDNEIFEGAYSAEYWEYDSRVGRRWNLDPKPQINISDYACFGNNPISMVDILGLSKDWHWSEKSDGKKSETTVVADVGDDAKSLQKFLSNQGLDLNASQINKLNSFVKNEENSRMATFEIDGKKYDFQEDLEGFEINMTKEIFIVRLHISLINGKGIVDSQDGHVGIEFESKVHNYWWNTSTDPHSWADYKKNPLEGIPGQVYVDDPTYYIENGNGNHDKIGGADYYTDIPLTLDQYRALSFNLHRYDNTANQTGTNVPNYALFEFEKNKRCQSWSAGQLMAAGIHMGLNSPKLNAFSPKILYRTLKANHYMFNKVPTGSNPTGYSRTGKYLPLW